MSTMPFDDVADISARIASLTSISRAVADDTNRLEKNGGSRDELYNKVAKSAIKSLRRTATRLEQTL